MLLQNNFSRFLIIASLWFAAFASLYSDAWNAIALYAVLPFAFIVSFVRNGFKLATNKYMLILTMLYLWCLLACLWATYIDNAIRHMSQILGTFILSYIFAVNVKDKKIIPWLYGTYIILFLSAWLYAQSHILINVEAERFRLGDDKLNANKMAYYLFYVTFLVYMLGEITSEAFVRTLWKYLFWLMIPLTFVTALLTASRQVLIIQIPLISVLLYLRYIKNRGLFRKSFFVLFIIVAVIAISPYVIQQYSDSYLAERSEREVGEDARITLLFDAIQVGWEHFPLGVGPGNYGKFSYSGSFSHNSFAELWATVGIVGVSLYCYLMFLFVKRQWSRYRNFQNKKFFVFFIFGLIYILDGFFYVFHNGVWLMAFFILVASHSEEFSKNNI